MKRNILKLSIYGTVCAIYTAAFLFGAMYPQYGIPKNSIVIEDTRTKENDGGRKIVYRSYFTEKIKALLEE